MQYKISTISRTIVVKEEKILKRVRMQKNSADAVDGKGIERVNRSLQK